MANSKKQEKTKAASSLKRNALRVIAHLNLAGLDKLDFSKLPLGLLSSMLNGKRELDIECLISDSDQLITFYENENPKYTFAHRGANGAGFWDYTLKAFAEFSPYDMPISKIDAANNVKFKKRDYGKKIHVELQVDDPELGEIYQEIVYSCNEEWKEFAEPFFKAVHCGPICHENSGLPYKDLSTLGFIISEKTFLKGSKTPLTELNVSVKELSKLDKFAFYAPKDFRSLLDVTKPINENVTDIETPNVNYEVLNKYSVQSVKNALENLEGTGRLTSALRIRENITSQCLDSTRFGSISATIHQDLFDNLFAAVNTIAPFIGTATLTSGTITVPWLASLAAIQAANSTAPGSGLFCLLRDPRRNPPNPAVTTGQGLLDKLAWKFLSDKDGNGMTPLQNEFNAGTIGSSLLSWGVPLGVITALTANGGDITKLTISQRITVVEAYETVHLGVFRILGIPTIFGPFTLKSIMDVSITGVGGIINFGSLRGGLLITNATIGSNGNLVLGLVMPDIFLTAMISRSLTSFGWTVLIAGTLGTCLFIPLLCPIVFTLAVLMAFIMNNVTSVGAATTGVTLTLDVSWKFDPISQILQPFVTIVSSTGATTVTTTWVTPNIIANIFDTFVTGIGNLFNLWLSPFTIQIAKAIETALRKSGFQLPVANRQTNLIAVDGSAISTLGTILNLQANIQPMPAMAAQPFVTQVNTSSVFDIELNRLHRKMRNELNPQPVLPTSPFPVITVGTYVGMGLSQNALNYYLFSQWINKRFEAGITDPSILLKIVKLIPAVAAKSALIKVHMWSASPPRIETMPVEIVANNSPLLVFFDDVRACFEFEKIVDPDNVRARGLELSFNIKTTGTILFEWPMIFSLVLDNKPLFCDERSWELTDLNVLNAMVNIKKGDLALLAVALSNEFLSQLPQKKTMQPPPSRPWNRELIATQQEILESLAPNAFLKQPQMLYTEILHRRKGLYLLPAVDSMLLQLVDGSGAPTLNELLKLMLRLGVAPGVSLSTMTCLHGSTLRILIPLPIGP